MSDDVAGAEVPLHAVEVEERPYIEPRISTDAFPIDPPAEPEPELSDEEKARLERREMTQRALRHRAEIYVEMSKTEAFKELLAEFERKRVRLREQFAASLFVDKDKPIDQRRADREIGFIDGLDFLSKTIEGAQNTLKQFDEEAAERAVASKPADEEEFSF